MCGELVLAAAKKCRFCGEWFDEALRETVRGRGQEQRHDAPIVMKVWGGLLMAGSAMLGALQVLQAVMMAAMIAPSRGGAGAMVGMFVALLLSLAICGVFVRLGWGLWRGERNAVIGMAVMAALGLGLAALLLADGTKGAQVGAAVMAGLTLVGCAPPTAVGIAAWSRLR